MIYSIYHKNMLYGDILKYSAVNHALMNSVIHLRSDTLAIVLRL